MLLVFLLLMSTLGVSSSLLANLFPCSSNNRSGILHFSEHTDFKVCCELLEDVCNITTFKDTLTLLPQNRSLCSESCISERVHRQSACFVMFEVKNASSVDEGMYECKMNTVVYAKKTLYIIEKPIVPVIISFSCTQNNNLTVVFNRGVPRTKYIDSYNVTMTVKNGITTLCNSTSVMCKPGDPICTCKYTNTSDKNPIATNIATITVIASRSVQSSNSSRNYSMGTVIQPGPVKRLSVKDVGPHNVSIQFCMSDKTLRLYAFMSQQGVPLQYHLQVIREQGATEILNATLPSKVSKNTQFFMCMRVYLPNLIAFTNYAAIVSTSGGGGESLKSKLDFITSQIAPNYPPLVDKFSFSRLDKINVSSTLMSVLIILWKPLPHDAKGGSNLSYYVEVTSENGFRDNITTQETYAVVIDKSLPLGPLIVHIWSQNVIGRSQNYTLVEVPPKSSTSVPYIIVEFDGDKALVYVNITNLKRDAQLSIHWCLNYTDQIVQGRSICQEYPQTANYSIKTSADKIQQFEINMRTVDEQREDILSYRTINYTDLQKLDSVPRRSKTINVTVTYPANTHQTFPDYDFYVDDLDPDMDVNYYNYYEDYLITRTRRDANEFPNTTPKVFISMKMENNVRNSGLMLPNCYFDVTKTNGKPKLIVAQMKYNKVVTLKWTQECSPNVPVQFMADYFQVSSSTDGDCNSNRLFIQTVRNEKFKPNLMQLPEGIQFACIQICKNGGYCSSEFHVTSIDYSEASEESWTSVIVGSVVSFILLLVVLIYFICCCKSRRRQLEEKLGTSWNINLPKESSKDVTNDHLDTELGGVPPDVPERTILHSISIDSTDSGRGTGVEENQRTERNTSAEKHVSAEHLSNGDCKIIKNSANCSRIDPTGSSDTSSIQREMVDSGDIADSEENADDENGDVSGRSEKSDIDQQQQVFKENDCIFKPLDSGGSQQSLCSVETFSITNNSNSTDSSDAFENKSDITFLDTSDESSSVQVKNAFENHVQFQPKHNACYDNGLERSVSSESESDADSERAVKRPLFSVV